MKHWSVGPESASLHQDALVWDAHGCMPLVPEGNSLEGLRRYRDSGVDMVHLNVADSGISLEQLFRVLAFMRAWLRARPDEYLLAGTADDVRRAKREGKLAVAFDVEGTAMIGDQTSLIETLYDLGVRWMLLAYNRSNRAGGGCHDEDPGLSAFGREVVDEMARVGMLVCCSHTGYRTTMDVCEYSRRPVILSHSNPRALCDHERNVPDEVIRACASTGGVIGINGVGLFLGDNDTRSERLVRHIDYAVQLVGPDHVGLGLDFTFDMDAMTDALATEPGFWPEGRGYDSEIAFVAPEQLPEVTERLFKLGYQESAIRGILGDNFLRVAERVWK